MAKKSAAKKHDVIEMENFMASLDFPECGHDDAAAIFAEYVEVTKHQQNIAIELTKIIVEKNSDEKMNAEEIFSIFKQATEVAIESYPAKTLIEQIAPETI